MNKYLLDTNILIWVLADSSNISPTIKSQAICEDMIILSADTVFPNYSIRVIE